jgi:hypothetical protein
MSNELKNAIETARRVHDRTGDPANHTHVILGALIRAVEILTGDQDRGVTDEGEAPTNETQTFPDELVERLRRTYLLAWAEHGADGPIKNVIDNDRVVAGILAVLCELAKAPCELPTVLAIESTIADAYERKQYDAQECATIVHRWIVNAVAPILAAKSATIELQAKRITELEKRLAEATTVFMVDGKTPGDVDYDARAAEWARHGFNVSPRELRTENMVKTDEAGALAVLRVFGNGAEALRRVRERAQQIETQFVVGGSMRQPDTEIAKLDAKT